MSVERDQERTATTDGPDDAAMASICEHVWAVIDWWRGANEAPGGCSSREAIDGMREHIFALRDLTDYGQPPNLAIPSDVRRLKSAIEAIRRAESSSGGRGAPTSVPAPDTPAETACTEWLAEPSLSGSSEPTRLEGGEG